MSFSDASLPVAHRLISITIYYRFLPSAKPRRGGCMSIFPTTSGLLSPTSQAIEAGTDKMVNTVHRPDLHRQLSSFRGRQLCFGCS
jgi:hypothetical protein